ncbi:sensor histidine kinase [Fibrella aquatilis]|uniref:Histidine kinase n=1 Tax=Fibrella aquatilis TaxID=2817059 RepID=A0A939JZB8_9BACT|nr:histidine kinase [Fibrella aquatilis]MBO0932979.1 histidine kinase [Fibrella aquatilis]
MSTLLQRLFRNKRFLVHLLVWVGYYLVNSALLYFTNMRYLVAGQLPFTLALLAILFYTNIYVVIAPNIRRGTYVQLVVSTMVLLALYTYLRYALLYNILPMLDLPSMYNGNNQTVNAGFVPDSLWLAVQYLLVSYGYYFAVTNIDLQRQKRYDERRILDLQLETKRAELAFLRTQLNPHFLFNTLNFFFADALKTSPRLADAIMNLSQMLRSITEVGQNELVPVAQEIAYIRHYLKIQEYRFSNRLQVAFVVEGEDLGTHFLIPPLILISLVENIFKYGDIFNETVPAHIYVGISASQLSFTSVNVKRDTPAYTQTGLGLSNVDKQLKLAFPGQTTLTSSNVDDVFRVDLCIRVPH